MEIEDILSKIKENRKKKGFSYETMALEMNTSTAAYRKIEMNQTKLTVERLFQISEILEIPLANLLDINNKNILHQINRETSTGYLQQIENFHQENIDKSQKIENLYEARLRDKDILIENLQKTIESLTK
ncbi:helix-turn-helix domain-containing protein [Flavobacterium sp.]|uniref:helix-turn-helix domain-containing protein n=1 Tax=Flavobacterium sp. TaxID=239 RepID=UPI003D1294F2